MPDTTAPHHPAAVAIANWWADKSGTLGDTGDRSPGAGFTMALAVVAGAQGQTMLRSKRPEFVDALARRVTAELERYAAADWQNRSVTVGVDYGPDPMLADAAEEAGIPRGVFPWKTMTWTYPTHVVASLGYHGRDQLVWSADDWEHPVCGQGQWDLSESSGGRLPWKCSALRYHETDHVFDVPDPLCVEMVARFDGTEVCNRPKGHDYHVQEDGYTSPMYHDFKAGA